MFGSTCIIIDICFAFSIIWWFCMYLLFVYVWNVADICIAVFLDFKLWQIDVWMLIFPSYLVILSFCRMMVLKVHDEEKDMKNKKIDFVFFMFIFVILYLINCGIKCKKISLLIYFCTFMWTDQPLKVLFNFSNQIQLYAIIQIWSMQIQSCKVNDHDKTLTKHANG